MIKLSQDELENIIKQDLPGYKVYDESGTDKSINTGQGLLDSAENLQAEASTPDLQSMRRKYFGEENVDSDFARSIDPANNAGSSLTADVSDSDGKASDEIIAVKRENSAHPWDRGSRPKAAVISGSEKKVIGEQG